MKHIKKLTRDERDWISGRGYSLGHLRAGGHGQHLRTVVERSRTVYIYLRQCGHGQYLRQCGHGLHLRTTVGRMLIFQMSLVFTITYDGHDK